MKVIIAIFFATLTVYSYSGEADFRQINNQLENATTELNNLNRGDIRCPEERIAQESAPALSLNPRHHRPAQPERSGFFYELQYAVTGRNGQQSFISTPIGTVNLGQAVEPIRQ